MLLTSLCTLLALAGGGTITVPTDAPDLQAAIDLAVPGSLILVQTADFQEPVVIDKPLTILGDPQANVLIGLLGDCTSAAFHLAGDGEGTVTLAGVRTATGADCLFPPSAIDGGGFDELQILDSEVYAAASGLTGLGYGSAAIAVDTPFVVVSGSTVVGGRDNADDCTGFLPGGGYPAVDAPESTVLVLDSFVFGGSGGLLCCRMGCTCPSSIAGLGGIGGTGIVAEELYAADSTIAGGIGSTFWAFEGPFPGTPVDCGKQPDGVPFVVEGSYDLPATLQGSGRLRIGATYTLSWDAPGPFAVLYASSALESPTAVPGGYRFLAGELAMIGVLPAGTPQSLTFTVPNAVQLLGLSIAFQLQDGAQEISRPVAGVVAR